MKKIALVLSGSILGLLFFLKKPAVEFLERSPKIIKNIIAPEQQSIMALENIGTPVVSMAKSNLDGNRSYSVARQIADKYLKVEKRKIHSKGLVNGGGEVVKLIDGYTGEILIGGMKYDYDHIISVNQLFTRYKHLLTDEQIGMLANVPENITPTIRRANISKSNVDAITWMNKGNSIEKYGINPELLTEKYNAALEVVSKVADKMIEKNIREGIISVN